MVDIDKRLTELEYVLKKLDNKYLQNIPQEVWNYINENKDRDYIFEYDESKKLEEQKLHLDTVSMLTYINIEYLLEGEQKKEMILLLREDEIIAEKQKREKYNPDNIFKNYNKENKIEENIIKDEVAMIEYKGVLFQKFINKIKSIFHIK